MSESGPSDFRGRQRMCHGKKRYPTQTKAIGAAIGSSRTFGKPMRPYRCPVCKKWHLTSEVLDE